MAYEVLSARFLVQGLLATSHALAVMLAAFLAGMALGARLVASRLAQGMTIERRHLGGALLTAAALGAALAPGLTESAFLVESVRGVHVAWRWRLGTEAAVSLMLLLPVTTALGTAFPLASAIAAGGASAGASTSRVLLYNTLAGVAGALLGGFALVPALGPRGALVLVLALLALTGLSFLRRDAAVGRARLGAAAAGAALLLAACALWARPARVGEVPGRGTMVPQHVVGHEDEYRVLCARESPTASTVVLRHLPTERRDLLIDGFVAAGDPSEAGYMALMGSLPVAVARGPRSTLVICFGTGSTSRAAARAAPSASLDIVDINPDVFACAGSFGEENLRLLRERSAHVDDGRSFLRRTARVFDVITQEPMPPHFAGVSALYSVEYYRLARRRLSPDGVMVQWLPMHLTTPDDTRAIAAAAQAVFPETWLAIAPLDHTGLLVMSPRPIPRESLREGERRTRVSFVLDPAGVRRLSAGTAPVTDDLPSLEYGGVDRVLGTYGSSTGLLRYNLSLVAAARSPRGPR